MCCCQFAKNEARKEPASRVTAQSPALMPLVSTHLFAQQTKPQSGAIQQPSALRWAIE
jgi:hypothetical protein